MKTEAELVGQQILDAVKVYVSSAIEKVRSEIRSEFEGRIAEVPAGAPGKDADPEQIRAMVESAVQVAVSALPPAPKGEDGKDADLEAVHQFIREQIAELPQPINGKDGAPGVAGKDGESVPVETIQDMVRTAVEGIPAPKDGKDGAPGADGKDGVPGIDGKPGPQGATGERGIDGKDGRDGRNGIDGRDALELEILPAIDEKRSYRRGTFARHDGGIVRAVRDTDPLTDDFEACGWTVMVAGVSAVVVSQGETAREFSVGAMLTGGIMSVCEFHIPVPIYRGIWTQDGIYTRGDMVTFDGSTWHCEAEKATSKPGVDQTWKLVVKRGQNGKDGTLTEPKNPGPVRL